ncbi:WavE lipopolysaccharide synthesis OS=Flavobacterium johnsoniae (strain ATCC 17061 / DSM 2064 / UW101) GN=Fjoh_0346 PE=4 SV=1: WavE [Gemmataceae bacterium]|nr:WavE lipopolysaccharide synthesis OS=Flavobacterium johnsoniae (strain ATCC 17061 / DSM 2064 / UW101) GN=Fjoh_0346 PE=4 SV=1: WavE [Gemmataceae bacterium]VTU00947.1 WavE lipopolysaccharide synthesis OS=Flavobacterium johnsoniae (strain ATCC 17061 / DSM 2064 / UW101) GN=Fjoh_0346 PE=4 SV=1: WavE [Gemmataceae bacterium]
MVPVVTASVLDSVRQHLPGSEVILSTWKGSDCTGLAPDVIAENDDPGPIPTPGKTNNVNRQIVSTRRGLALATRRYAMKLRSDTPLVGSQALEWYSRSLVCPRPKEPRVFRERILTCRHFTRNPERSPWLFHPSDIFMLGLHEDLNRLWNVRLVTGDRALHAASGTGSTQLAWKPRTQMVCAAIWGCDESQQAPEQYLWLACLRRFAGLAARKSLIRIPSPSNLWLSERSLLANFYTAETDDLGIRLPPRIAVGEFGFKVSRPSTCYSNEEWERLSALYSENPRPFSRGLPTLLRQVRAMLRDEHIHRVWAHMLFHRDGALRRRVRSLFRQAEQAK